MLAAALCCLQPVQPVQVHRVLLAFALPALGLEVGVCSVSVHWHQLAHHFGLAAKVVEHLMCWAVWW